MKLILTITASEWTKDNIDSFIDWIRNEIMIGNMGTGDDAQVTEWRIEE